jgi:hypothetical protein
MMDKINDLFQLLKLNKPFALTRFNDGEMRGIISPKNTYTAARGDQFINEELQGKLREALFHKQQNYWKGIPCQRCFPDLYDYAESLIGNYEYKTYAVIQTNRNLQTVVSEIGKLVKGHRIIWVSGEDQEINHLNYVGIDVNGFIPVPTQDAWRMYGKIKNLKFKQGDIVFLSCGPLAEVLIYEWFKNNPNVTFIDIGSVFDPLTRNVWHRCHTGDLPKCEECN